MKTLWSIPALSLMVLLASQGCAAVGLAVLGASAGTAAGQGLSYTLDSIAYKTFTAPIEGLEMATIKSLERMEIELKAREMTETGRKIIAQAGDREIDIELDSLTPRTARMRVNVKQGWFFKDRATAAEIITQTAQTLDDEPRLSRPYIRTPVAQPARVQPASR